MTNENDINDALKKVNQNMLLNKKKIDIDNIVESLLLFFSNYFDNLSKEVFSKIKEIKNIKKDNQYQEIIDKLIITFFDLLEKKIKETTLNNFNSIKDKISTLSDSDCNKELNYITSIISNELSDYYLENANNLVEELNKNLDNSKVTSEYILEIIYHRVINTLKDRLMYSIKVIDNNNEENNQFIENINEKTITKV